MDERYAHIEVEILSSQESSVGAHSTRANREHENITVTDFLSRRQGNEGRSISVGLDSEVTTDAILTRPKLILMGSRPYSGRILQLIWNP
jgi:hypothetical protein